MRLKAHATALAPASRTPGPSSPSVTSVLPTLPPLCRPLRPQRQKPKTPHPGCVDLLMLGNCRRVLGPHLPMENGDQSTSAYVFARRGTRAAAKAKGKGKLPSLFN